MTIATPKAHLIAHTAICEPITQFMDINPDASEVETLIEFAGRACYQSFHRPVEATNTTEKYIANTLFNRGHWSIAEHASATFYITGVSRAFTHELIRHRHLSFSQLSQRFVDESKPGVVIPPALRDYKAGLAARNGEELTAEDALQWISEKCALNYGILTDALTEEGLSRKQAREAARAVLPNMVETRIVVTGNIRAWKEVINRRTQPDVDAEMQEVMGMIADQLATIAPNIFPAKEQ